MFSQAVELTKALPAAGLLAYWEQIGAFDGLEAAADTAKLVLVLRGEENLKQARKLTDQAVVAPKAMLTREAQITLGVLAATSQGMFNPEELVVCLVGPCGRARVDLIQVVRVKESGPALGRLDGTGPGSLSNQVFNAVLNLAVELAQEGREGRPIGTIIVLGDHEKTLQFSTQAILNPFAGYPEGSLSILSEEMKETVREYSSLDGAFLVRGDGVLLAAGRQIRAASADPELPQGMGARHHAAAGITTMTEAVALAISESSGTVTVFHQGKILASLEKAKPDLTVAEGD